MKKINLNADLGESFGAWRMGADDEMMGLINSANIACGFHAGDPLVMRNAIQCAQGAGVEIGAHPSYPDLQGFGRRRLSMSSAELWAAIVYQLAALDGMARSQGARMIHVKPHGALNNAACEDRELADLVARAIKSFDANLILLAPALSQLELAGRSAGLRVAKEVFADRRYADDASLAPRSQANALIDDPEEAFEHVARILHEKCIVSVSGRRLPCEADSVCVHGDGAHAVALARHVKQRLSAHGWRFVGLAEFVEA